MKKLSTAIYNNRQLLRRGDTLIEVIFAFAILATIIGFAFTGVIQARRGAIAAQERTQALEIAQYQTEALQTYRNSMKSWDGTDGTCPSFLGGTCLGANKIKLDNSSYCLLPASGVWQLQTNASNCNSLAPYLHLNSGSPVAQIQFGSIGRLQASGTTTSADNNTVQATISINWTDPYGQNQTVKNIVILTRQK
jgi:type II secretory pathway pseudopilin PulG